MEKKGRKGSYQENADGVIDLDDDDDEEEVEGDTDDGDFSSIFKEDNDDCSSGSTNVKSENGGFGDDSSGQRSKRVLPGSLGGKESADGTGEEPEGPDLLAQLYMAHQSRTLKGSSSSSSSSSSSTYHCTHNGTTNPHRMPSINNMTGSYSSTSSSSSSAGCYNPIKTAWQDSLRSLPAGVITESTIL